MNDTRVVLVTGASRGIGMAISRHHLEIGDLVIGCARSPSEIEHPHYRHVCMDVSDSALVDRLFSEIRRDYEKLDVLISNAGAASMNSIALTPAETARKILDVNFLGAFLFIRGAIRLMRNSQNGRMVNLTTVAVPLRLEGEAVYAASKSAVETLTRIAAKEVAPFGITCNAVGPCPIKTRLTERVPEQKMQSMLAKQAIRRWAQPSDVINVIDFLLKPESNMITGQVIYLGGVG